MTRHELKALEADPFADKVGSALNYTAHHKGQVVRWVVGGALIVLLVGLGFWYRSHQKAIREADLSAALAVMDGSVGNETSKFVKSYPTQDAKDQAAVKAFSEVASKHSGTKEGAFAQYYLGTIKGRRGDPKAAEADLKAAIGSDDEVGSLAKLALAQLYSGENRSGEAQPLLQGLIDKPTSLVSKEQAQLFLADLLVKKNPSETRKLLDAVRTKATKENRTALSRAADGVAARLGK